MVLYRLKWLYNLHIKMYGSVILYSQESIIYMMMFYLGSITRYRPHLFDSLFSNKEQWLVSEFLKTQPKQYLYLLTAQILGQQVTKAYAMF
ncbi:YaaC family protein [Pantoea sp. ACRSB]|uniref:YaaC family protein n=1 Tax=Pantoea sp. ACRSB TaxID=2918207 RepID=UPI0039089A51